MLMFATYLPLSHSSDIDISDIFEWVMSLCDAKNSTTSRFSFFIGTISNRHQNGVPKLFDNKIVQCWCWYIVIKIKMYIKCTCNAHKSMAKAFEKAKHQVLWFRLLWRLPVTFNSVSNHFFLNLVRLVLSVSLWVFFSLIFPF